MFYKTFLLLILSLLIIPSTFAYTYNSSWTDLVVDNEGWCADLSIPFTIYNETDYDNREEIEDEICKEDEGPDEDDCLEFSTIAGEVKIYDGPFDNEDKLLLDTDLSESSFSYTFEKEGVYLVEVFPTGKYNDWYNNEFYIDDCGIGDSSDEETDINETEVEEVSLLEDQSFYYENAKTTLDITSSGLNSSEDLTVKVFPDPATVGLTGLDNSIGVIQIQGEDNFTSLTITSELQMAVGGNSLYKIYKYDTVNSSWNEIGTGYVQGSNVIIESAELGIYSVTEEQEEIIEEVITTPEETTQEITLTQEQEESLPSPAAQSSTGGIGIMSWILILLLILVSIFGVVHMSKKKKGTKEQKPHEEEGVENNISSYADIMKKTQDYVTQYKEHYSKDQIYRALKDANVPKDIIDKVFALEY